MRRICAQLPDIHEIAGAAVEDAALPGERRVEGEIEELEGDKELVEEHRLRGLVSASSDLLFSRQFAVF